jgi:hypothetical protein
LPRAPVWLVQNDLGKIATGGGIKLVARTALAHPIGGLIAISNSEVIDRMRPDFRRQKRWR